MLTLLTLLARTSHLLVLIAMTTLVAAPVWAGSVRVPTDLANLQLAIDSAAPRDTVFVEAGTYTGDGNRNLNFRGKDIVVLGVDGPRATIIDCEGSESDPARGFIFESGERFSAVVSGFTIRNGYRPGDRGPGPQGGGMLIMGSGTRPTIMDCIFENNYADMNGGGLAVFDGASPTVRECKFSSNRSRYGGGGAFAFGDADFLDCVFLDNESLIGSGGGFGCAGGYRPVVRDCEFRRNSALNGGGFACSGPIPHLERCVFIGNTSSPGSGGGLYASMGSLVYIQTCLFIANRAHIVEGGAICLSGATAAVDRCTLYKNRSSVGAGVYVRESAFIELETTIIAFGIEGEAVACDGSSTATLGCCDIFGNEGGDWAGCIAAQADVNGNMSADPLFCNVGEENLHLARTSPCADSACGLIGRYGVACTSAVEERTWGGVKALYHR
jgi:parallel beta-helix repeat protein